MATFILVDDHSIILSSLRSVISSMGHVILDEAKTGIDAIKKINIFEPQYVILDISIPKLDGFEVIKRCPPNPNRKYIIFTSMPSSILEGYFKKINIDSYISKQEDIVEIKRKLHMYIDSSETVGNDKNSVDDAISQESDILESLSSRELLVLKYLAQGYRNKEIARELILSEKTVSTYKKRLMDKLCCSSISNLILFAHRNNLL
ncbi:response regulator transcription factor [Vibrio aestuarianus]|uniref:response regulator transcription factor n=1 Tax=Vibrio aestuarianus TaxID=28171 RepID=UPI0006A5D554|nr:response regulator transcription factor [Vibrio aestuarianus]KOE81553.1 DNA-binding response regulator BvgA [Vibrio alginolyticus]NGZ15635.1 response regulator transcription factor [Vibrio aestuarianus]NKZ51783.1 response regulator transcription factor [Vibrio aestuarianus]